MKKILIIIFLLMLIPFIDVDSEQKNFFLDHALVECNGDVITKEFNYDNDLFLFVGSKFKLVIENPNDYNLTFYASEYSKLNVVTFSPIDNYYETEYIETTVAGKYTIFIFSDDVDEYMIVDLTIYDEITDLSISAVDEFPLINEEITIETRINGSETVLCSNAITWFIDGEENESYIKVRTINSIILNAFFEEKEIIIKAKIFDIESNEIKVTVTADQEASFFRILDQEKVFLLGNEIGTVKALISKDSKPVIRVYDNSYSVKLSSVKKETYDENYDLLLINLNLLKEANIEIVITCLGNVNGNETIFSGVLNIKTLEEITEFTINANYDSIKYGESITFTAKVNGSMYVDTLIDWYIDNHKISENGYEYSYNFNAGGNHLVYAEIAGVRSNELAIFVDYTQVEVLLWYSLLGFALILGIPMIIFISKKHHHSRLKGIELECRNVNVVLKSLQKKYRKEKSIREKINYRKLINRINSIYNDADYEKHIHGEAVYEELKLNLSRATKILEVINKLSDLKSSKEIAKLLGDVIAYIDKALLNMESIKALQAHLKNKNKKTLD